MLIIVPILLGMAFSAILLLPKLAASAWESGSDLVSARSPDQGVLGVARLGRCACSRSCCPVLGVTLHPQRLVTSTGQKAWGWSGGPPPAPRAVIAGAAGARRLLAWAWWPSGQYQPVRPTDDGTLVGAFGAGRARRPPRRARPALAPVPPRLARRAATSPWR